MTVGSGPSAIADLSAFERRREHRAWYFYDWANSGYVTTVATVLFAPYLTSVAETAACGPGVSDDNPCHRDLDVLGVAV
jgi:UMF1 family MFS transporter